MRKTVIAALALAAGLAALPAMAQSASEQRAFDEAQARFDREYQIYREAVDRYRSAGGRGAASGGYRTSPDYRDPNYSAGWRDEGGYDPARDYRSGGQYQERVLAADDRIYSGNDGRYYCRRSDGTTGLIVGGAAGGILGNVIDGGRSRTVGTLLGGALGALAGRAVEQNQQQIRCR